MELKPLFVSPDETRIETAVLYTTDRSSGSSSTAGAVQLAPGEELRALLYIGCADRTLHVQRIIARAEPSGARYDFTSTFRHRKSLQHLSCDSNDSNGFSSSSSSSGGVSFLHVNGALDPPLLILVAGGVLDALHGESLADTNVFRRAAAALLPMGSIAACCAEPKPTELSSSLSLSLSLSSSSAVRASRGTLSRLALVVGRTLVVVEYDAHSARVVAPHSSSSHSSSYSSSSSLLPAGTSAVAWVEGDTIVTGSAHVYCVFDASTRQLRHTIAVGHGHYDDYNSHGCNNKNNNDNHHPSDGTSGTERGLARGPLLRGVPSMPHGMSLLLRSADLRIALLDAKDVGAMTTMMTALCAEPTALAAPIIEAIVSPPFVIAVGPDGALRARLLRGAWTGDAEDNKKDTDEDADELPVPSHHRSSFSSSSSSASTLRIDVREMRSLLSSPFGACAVLSGSVQHVTLAPAQTLTMLYMDAGKYGAALRHTTYLSAMKTTTTTATTTTTTATTATAVAVQLMGAKCASHALRTKRYAEAFRLFAQCATPTREILCLAPELTRGAGGKIMRTWTSGEPYSLLHAMLLQRYRSPAGQSEKKHIPNDTHSTDDKESIEERRAGDFALFLLHVLECVPHTEEGLAAVFAPESTLSADECLRYVSDSGYCPRPALVPLVLAHAGRDAEAIAHCRARGLAREAAAALRLSRGNEKNEETAAALPWLLAVDARAACTAAVSALTTTTTTTTTTSSSSTSADNELESFGSLGTSLRPLLPALLGHGGSALRECLRRAVITATGDEAPRVHTQYARSLIAALRVMRQCGLAGLSAPSVRVAAGEEVGPCGAMRRALLEFLRTSQQYDVDEVLALLMDAGLIEEQVLVHERVGDHVAALTAIVYELQDVPAAVRYCEAEHRRQKDTGHAVFDRVTRPDSSTTLATTTTTAATAMAAAQAKSTSKEPNDVVDDKDDSGNDDMAISGGAVHGARVFNEYLDTLLHVLLVPPVGHEPRLSDTLNVLCEHTDNINPLSALHALPGDVRVAEVEPYLLRVFKMLCFETQLAEVAANAAEAMVDEAERYLSLLRQRCVYVDERRPCAVCGETLGVGVTAVFPNLKATHFRCFRAPELDPERGVPFRPPL